MVDTEKLQEKLGEALGLEMAAQKAVEELGSKGLLDENGMLSKLKKMQSQAGNHQSKLEEMVHTLANESGGFDPMKIQQVDHLAYISARYIMIIITIDLLIRDLYYLLCREYPPVIHTPIAALCFKLL